MCGLGGGKESRGRQGLGTGLVASAARSHSRRQVQGFGSEAVGSHEKFKHILGILVCFDNI